MKILSIKCYIVIRCKKRRNANDFFAFTRIQFLRISLKYSVKYYWKLHTELCLYFIYKIRLFLKVNILALRGHKTFDIIKTTQSVCHVSTMRTCLFFEKVHTFFAIQLNYFLKKRNENNSTWVNFNSFLLIKCAFSYWIDCSRFNDLK